MALERETYTGPPAEKALSSLYPLDAAEPDQRPASRRAAAVAKKRRARARVEPPPVQILVVVASIQMRTLKAEVEKGSM